MATAKKTPSGQWKVRVYSHTTDDGKKHYRAFMAPTKQEAERKAAEYSGSMVRAARVDLTVREAINGYIRAKEGVLSPSTVRGYRKIERNYFDGIGHIRIRSLTNEQVQAFISEHSKTLSAKSVKNIYGLLTAAIDLYLPEKVLKIKLPPKEVKRAQIVNADDILALYEHARPWLKICIGLSAFGSLRRGEICSLHYSDLKDGVLYVHSDMVVDDNGKWIIKEIPKTQDSIRYVYTLPQDLLDLIGTGDPDARIVERTPNEVTKYFIWLRDELGIKCRFQDLRAFFASSAPILGISDTYLADFGGWRRGSTVIKQHYQRSMEAVSMEYAQKMRAHFTGIIQKSMTQSMTQE